MIKSGELVRIPSMSTDDRLWTRVRTAPNGCKEWQGGVTWQGYGKITIGSKKHSTERRIYTHRLAWELANGPIPNGLHVLHHCDNPPCCNVDHLFLGTNADNVADRMAKGRGNHTRGVRVWGSVLTPDLVVLIREAYASGVSCAALARAFGVNSGVVYRVVSGKSWAWVAA